MLRLSGNTEPGLIFGGISPAGTATEEVCLLCTDGSRTLEFNLTFYSPRVNAPYF